jgi:ankyrin repeat protein
MEAHVSKYNVDFDALQNAAKRGSIEDIDNMINHGTEARMELIHTATAAKHINVVNYLISRGFDPNAQNRFGETPLHIACKDKDALDLIQFLVAKGADPNIANKLGDTPLQIA